MTIPHNWNQLRAETSYAGVPVSRLFHPYAEGYYQFTDKSGQEYIALQSANPYGNVRLSKSAQSDLLMPVEIAQDFSLFEVPEDLITLKEVVVSQTSRNVEKLHAPLHDVGRIIGHLATEAELPPLKLANFGVARATGKVLLLPPVTMHEGVSEQPKLLQGIANSLTVSLGSFMTSAIKHDLVEEVIRGAEE